MKLHDYKCRKCGSVFERMDDKDVLPCAVKICLDWADRQLGGRPALSSSATPNMGGYERQMRFSPIGQPVTVPACEHRPKAVLQVGLIETRSVPKARA